MLRLYIKKIIFCIILLLLVAPLSISASEIDNIYNDLKVLERSSKISRKSYLMLGDKFYKIYSTRPNDKRADEALLGAARTYRRSFERFKIKDDKDRSLRYYRILQGAFRSNVAKDSYLECADLFLLLKDPASAKFTLNKVIKKYPKSAQANKAKIKLSNISNKKKAVVSAETIKPKSVTDTIINKVEKNEPIQSKNIYNNVNISGKDVVVHGLRYFSDKDYTRVVIDLSENANFESHWLKADKSINKPPRLTIDINGSLLSANVAKEIAIKDGLLSSVRLGYHGPEKRTRIVLDSENVKDFIVFQMSSPSRIVVDVFSEKQGLAKRGSNSINNFERGLSNSSKQKVTSNNFNKNNSNSSMTLGAALGLKIKTIVIDAGHGGKDPGAVVGNLREKDIILEIAKHLRDYLKANTDLNVYMTRDKDIFIPLEERTAIANRYKADIFVSIHANSARNKKASGIETYVFNVTNDKAALEVAALENQATTKSISDLQGILKDILKYSKLEESLSLAGSVQNSLVKGLKLERSQNLGVKQAPFYVLVGATMPSILIETGFITNSRDSAKLRTPSYRKEVAKGIYNGLIEYISKYNN